MEFLKQTWTIARHSIMQAMRMKVVLILLAFLMVLVPALPFLLKADETHAGQVRMVITYSIYAISFLLTVLTIFLSAMTLNTEIKQQQIFLLSTKPVSRLTILLGKWAGVMMINIVLLTVMLGVSYGCFRYMSRQRQNESPEAYALFKTGVLNARRYVTPPLPNFDKPVEAEYDELKAKNLLTPGKSEVAEKKQIEDRLKNQGWAVAPGQVVKWTISGLPRVKESEVSAAFDGNNDATALVAKTKDWLTIRFRNYGSGGKTAKDYKIPGRFDIYPSENGKEYKEEVYWEDEFQVNSFITFDIPARLAGPEGEITITYKNNDTSGVSAIFQYKDGITVMYGATNVGWNFARAGGLILIKLTFYSILGLAFSSVLSFPIAVAATFVIFMVSQAAGFLNEMFSTMVLFGDSMAQQGPPLVHPVDAFLRGGLSLLLSVFPNMGSYDLTTHPTLFWVISTIFGPFARQGAYDATSYLTDGRIIDYGVLASMFFSVIIVRGGIAAVIGWVLFRRRELAALTANT